MKMLLQSTRRPDISFCRDGRISVTAKVARALDIRPGDSINVAFQLDECFLVCEKHSGVGRHVAQCHPSNRGSRRLCANSVALARAMLDRCGVAGPRAAFFTGQAVRIGGRLCLPIIHKMPL